MNPIIGRIYLLRCSVRQAFGLDTKKSSSSFASSASSAGCSASSSLPLNTTKEKRKRFRKRRCLILDVETASVTILPMTQFDGQDPASENVKDEIVLPELSREYLLKNLLSIHPTEPVAGRRSVNIEAFSGSSNDGSKPSNSFIVLKPISVPIEAEWPNPIPDFFTVDEMLYISDVIYALSREEKANKIRNSQNQMVHNVIYEDNKDSETTGSSLPTSRVIVESFGKDDLDKSMRIEQWLNDSTPSCNIVEDIDQCWSTINYSGKSTLILFNRTGQDISFTHLHGLEFSENTLLLDVILNDNECLPLLISNEHESATLTFSEEQDFQTRHEFTIKIGDFIKTVHVTPPHKQLYDLGPSSIPNWPVQIACDYEIRNNHRFVILCSIIKVCNNTAIPLVISSINPNDIKQYHRISKINLNEEYDLPIDLIYAQSTPTIFISVDKNDSNGEINEFISFDWEKQFSVEKKLELTNGTHAHFALYKKSIESYSESTNELAMSFILYITDQTFHSTKFIPTDIQFVN